MIVLTMGIGISPMHKWFVIICVTINVNNANMQRNNYYPILHFVQQTYLCEYIMGKCIADDIMNLT